MDIKNDDKFVRQTNLKAIRKVDNSAVDIIDTASQVGLYIFNTEGNKWDKKNVEGALFIYERSQTERYGMFILNRLNISNYMQLISPGMNLDQKIPFLLYRNANGEIYGLWFYSEDDCNRIAKRISELLKHSSHLPSPPNNVLNTQPSSSNNVSNHQESSLNNELSGIVKDFFALAGGSQNKEPTNTSQNHSVQEGKKQNSERHFTPEQFFKCVNSKSTTKNEIDTNNVNVNKLNKKNGIVVSNEKEIPLSSETEDHNVELTKEQLIKALQYFLCYDEDFKDKLYNLYKNHRLD